MVVRQSDISSKTGKKFFLCFGAISISIIINYFDFPFYFQISDAHDNIIRVKTMGFSYEKRPIQLISLSLNSSKNELVNKKAIFLECGIHSSEWISPAFCLYAISKLVETHNSNGPLNHFDFYIMPVLNPDGIHYSWKHLRMWRKNRRPHNCSEMDPIKSYPEHAKGGLISETFSFWLQLASI